ncbi:hypothetical protein V6U90_27715 [Micromonospora sp. CPCC 206060]
MTGPHAPGRRRRLDVAGIDHHAISAVRLHRVNEPAGDEPVLDTAGR